MRSISLKACSITMSNCGLVLMVLCAVALASCLLASCQSGLPNRDEARPLFDVLEDAGYHATGDEMVALLQDDQKAALEIAYEASASSGYRGSFEEWAAHEVLARVDNKGDIAVFLPDGSEFTLLKSDLKSALAQVSGESDASNEANKAENSAGSISSPASGNAQDSSPSGNIDEQNPSRQGDNDPRSEYLAGDSNQSPSANEKPAESTSESEGPSTGEGFAHNNDTRLIVDAVKANPGDDNVLATIRVKGNPGILGLTFSLSYDDSALRLRSVENGEAFRDVLSLTHSRSLNTGCAFTWDGLEIERSDIRDGSVLDLYFDVNDDATPGMYPLVIHGESALVSNLTDIALTVEDGSVLIG